MTLNNDDHRGADDGDRSDPKMERLVEAIEKLHHFNNRWAEAIAAADDPSDWEVMRDGFLLGQLREITNAIHYPCIFTTEPGASRRLAISITELQDFTCAVLDLNRGRIPQMELAHTVMDILGAVVGVAESFDLEVQVANVRPVPQRTEDIASTVELQRLGDAVQKVLRVSVQWDEAMEDAWDPMNDLAGSWADNRARELDRLASVVFSGYHALADGGAARLASGVAQMQEFTAGILSEPNLDWLPVTNLVAVTVDIADALTASAVDLGLWESAGCDVVLSVPESMKETVTAIKAMTFREFFQYLHVTGQVV